MNLEVKVKVKDYAEDSGLRTTTVKLAKDYITTPIKSIDTSKFYAGTIFPKELFLLSEFYLSFNEETIKRFYSENEYKKRKNYSFNSHNKKISDNTTTLTIIQYKKSSLENAPAKYEAPSDTEIKSLVNAAYSFTDITAIPTIPRLARKTDVENFNILLDYIDSTIERISKYNRKKIMGYIPILPSVLLERLVDHYLDRGINAFFLDFDGTTFTSHLSDIDVIKRTLGERGYEKNTSKNRSVRWLGWGYGYRRRCDT